MRIGIFGGTFDPPHTGHLIAAQDCLTALRLDRVHFVPARMPPHKRGRPLTAPDLRMEMLSAALAGDDRFVADDIELRRRGPSWTVDTLREYRTRYPDTELFLLVGMDQYAEFGTWREPDAIVRLATVVVMARGGEQPRTGEAPAIAVTRIDVSSTQIRERVRRGEPIRYLVPDAVARIIVEHELYGLEADTGRVGPAAAVPNRPGSVG